MATAPIERWHTVPSASTLRDEVTVRILHSPTLDSQGIVVFCHGLGMGAGTYRLLQRGWAEHGYTVVAPEFSDSLEHLADQLPGERIDREDPTGWMTNERVVTHALGLMFDPTQWIGRAIDACSVIDHLAELVDGVPGADPGAVVVVGHSYGAHTAQLVGGVLADGATGLQSYRHDAVVGAVVMSPQGSGERGLVRASWAGIDIPWLVVSGEHDTAARGQGVEWRREAYDFTPPGGRQLAIVRDADHGLGGIAGSAPIYRDDPGVAAAIANLTTAFIRAAFEQDLDAVTLQALRTGDDVFTLESK